ncbi:MAG: 3D domain-containing protein [Butyricicoccus sp.]
MEERAIIMHNRISRTLRLVLLTAVTAAVLATSAFAASYKTTASVYLRERPRVNADTIKVIKSGAKVQSIKDSKDGEWMKVTYGSQTGYVYKKFLRAVASPQSDLTERTTTSGTGSIVGWNFASTDLSANASNGVSLGQFKLTFYCGCTVCSEQWGTQTATGTTCVEGRTIAVDPTVIPYGSKVHIDGFGDFIAEDCGGAIKGNRIDIYVADHARCNALGVQYANVTIID